MPYLNGISGLTSDCRVCRVFNAAEDVLENLTELCALSAPKVSGSVEKPDTKTRQFTRSLRRPHNGEGR
jgi:hypothetical protein